MIRILCLMALLHLCGCGSSLGPSARDDYVVFKEYRPAMHTKGQRPN